MSDKLVGGYLFLYNNFINRRELYKIEGIEPRTGMYLAYNKDRKLVYGSILAVRSAEREGYFIPSGERVPAQWLLPQQPRRRRPLWRRLMQPVYATLSKLAFRLRLKSAASPA